MFLLMTWLWFDRIFKEIFLLQFFFVGVISLNAICCMVLVYAACRHQLPCNQVCSYV